MLLLIKNLFGINDLFLKAWKETQGILAFYIYVEHHSVQNHRLLLFKIQIAVSKMLNPYKTWVPQDLRRPEKS